MMMMMIMRFLIIITLICFHVTGFCIYNDSDDTDFVIHQFAEHTSSTLFSRFKREKLKMGENVCCPYTEDDCVYDRNKDTIVYLSIQRRINNREFPNFRISLPGGGWVRLAGHGIEHSIIEVFNADGVPFDFDYESAVDQSVYS